MPWIQGRYHVTADPGQIALGGSSAGGLAAVYAALEHSEVFGNVLSQSGGFRLVPEDEEGFGWLISSPKGRNCPCVFISMLDCSRRIACVTLAMVQTFSNLLENFGMLYKTEFMMCTIWSTTVGMIT
jgi:hypothetical protein